MNDIGIASFLKTHAAMVVLVAVGAGATCSGGPSGLPQDQCSYGAEQPTRPLSRDPDLEPAVIIDRQRRIAEATAGLAALYLAADDANTRDVAYKALITVGLDRSPRSVAKAALSALVHSDREDVKAASLQLLSQLGPHANIATPALLGISRGDGVWRAHAVRALGRIGIAPGVAPELLRVQKLNALRFSGDVVEADIALGRLRVREGIPGICQHLTGGDVTVRASAAKALGLMGPPVSQKVVQDLVGACSDRSPKVREEAVRATGYLGYSSKPVLDAIVLRLGDEDGNVQKAAIAAVGELGASRSDLVQKLLGLTASPDIWVALRAREVLEAGGWRDLKTLSEMFLNSAPKDRVRIGRILAKTSPEGAQFLCRVVRSREEGAYDALAAMKAAPVYASLFEEAVIEALSDPGLSLPALDAVAGLGLTSQRALQAVMDLGAKPQLDDGVRARVDEVLENLRLQMEGSQQ